MSFNTPTIVDALREATDHCSQAKARVEKFAADFAKNPGYAMEHADAGFVAAAQLEVTTIWVASLRHTFEDLSLDPEKPEPALVLETWELQAEAAKRLLAHAREQAERELRWPSRSTSPSHNLYCQFRATAFYELATNPMMNRLAARGPQ